MNVLALDLGRKCGWAHSGGMSGVWDLSIKPDESSGMRLVRLRAKLETVYNALGVHLLVFEAARNLRFGNAVRSNAEFQAVVKLWAHDRGVEYKGYSPKQIKKFATGKGTASKTAMLAAAKTKWPDLEIIDDNHADALWLLELAKSDLSIG